MATRIARRSVPEVKHVAHRVYAMGERHHRHEVVAADAAHAHAASTSKAAGPHQRFEVRAVPSHVAKSAGGSTTMIPNPEGRYEVVVALYQGGQQIPIA